MEDSLKKQISMHREVLDIISDMMSDNSKLSAEQMERMIEHVREHYGLGRVDDDLYRNLQEGIETCLRIGQELESSSAGRIDNNYTRGRRNSAASRTRNAVRKNYWMMPVSTSMLRSMVTKTGKSPSDLVNDSVKLYAGIVRESTSEELLELGERYGMRTAKAASESRDARLNSLAKATADKVGL